MFNHSVPSTPAAIHGAVVSHIGDGSAARAVHSRIASRQPGLAVLTKRQRGMAMLEYIILAALLAIATIGVTSRFGDAMRDQIAGLASEIAGVDSAPNRANAEARAAAATAQARRERGMSDFAEGNRHK